MLQRCGLALELCPGGLTRAGLVQDGLAPGLLDVLLRGHLRAHCRLLLAKFAITGGLFGACPLRCQAIGLLRFSTACRVDCSNCSNAWCISTQTYDVPDDVGRDHPDGNAGGNFDNR